MDLVNQVYNGDFLLAGENYTDFPDGWRRTGGDTSTSWTWTGSPQGPRAVVISHPCGTRAAGIEQGFDVPVQAGDSQRWELQVQLQTSPPGVPCYAKIYLGARGVKVFPLSPGEKPQVFTKVFATEAGIGGLRLEIAILGEGDLIIHQVAAFRLYPLRALKLDEKGQIYVRHVESIGQIQKPVPVRMVSPVPIPVEVEATITGDIRALTPSRDGVRIYGSSGGALNGTPDGSLQVQLAEHRFRQSLQSLSAQAGPQVSAAQDISPFSVFSFAVTNDGQSSAKVQLEVSPDGGVWSADGAEHEIAPGTLAILTPTYFVRFNRVRFSAPTTTPLRVWFQAQT
ncbi:Hypothetical protein DEACI_0972 [Acididesulfobacillus acetoxydans]|uniref:DUF6385 domain-containing protein n=1 Tax=Acididesulfobacillus acetoxydans TaxID=1561005 RepID=A0A8S0W726_9FIRM|nr:DUF6385 domain-containing protein [Acididesulfobacillus acetoxydans]CAA7600319.1 Hypothetical protein DEACI_0972 [Acididesulfobacillus acetoxydans]CEJ06095.1 Hypothetical protein DEACI_0541 [Acididesulfobacillus acetoxydans]